MHKLTSNPQESAIRRGIKTVGIGKKGSQNLDQPLLGEIIEDLRQHRINPLSLGAFLAGLHIKGISSEEMELKDVFPSGTLTDPQKLAAVISFEAPPFVQDICLRLILGETLDQKTARQLGDFLMSDLPGESARGFVASLLRVRYETPDEYAGLLESISTTIVPAFRKPRPSGNPILQLAEPFDGVDHSYLITPLIANYFQSQDWRVVHVVGRNSGPKAGINLFEVAQGLSANFLSSSKAFEGAPSYGWFVDQKDLSPALDRWVDRRREIIKRPFLSTLEKFVNPLQADVLITSAFHPPYTEKMITIAERAGFPAAVVIRNGIEGTLAFALKRSVKIMCSARQENGEYLRYEFEFNPEEALATPVEIEEKLDVPSLSENIRLIENYQRNGASGNQLFDWRVQITVEGMTQALRWITENSPLFPKFKNSN